MAHLLMRVRERWNRRKFYGVESVLLMEEIRLTSWCWELFPLFTYRVWHVLGGARFQPSTVSKRITEQISCHRCKEAKFGSCSSQFLSLNCVKISPSSSSAGPMAGIHCDWLGVNGVVCCWRYVRSYFRLSSAVKRTKSPELNANNSHIMIWLSAGCWNLNSTHLEIAHTLYIVIQKYIDIDINIQIRMIGIHLQTQISGIPLQPWAKQKCASCISDIGIRHFQRCKILLMWSDFWWRECWNLCWI